MGSSEYMNTDDGGIRGKIKRNLRIRSSIYSRVVYIITLSSLILFLTFGVLFKSAYEEYLKNIIRQNGSNIGSFVEGSLYTSMLENDKSKMRSTLDIINTMTGIDDVNMYDENGNLVYSSFSEDSSAHSNPDCKACHTNMAEMFPVKEKAYRIVEMNSDCIMNENDNEHRHLLMRSPILNERSCYTSSCHAHAESDVVLGSLIIRMPLTELDNVVQKSSSKFYILATITTSLLILTLILFTNRRIRKPLKELESASLAVANGNKDIRLKIEPGQLDDVRMVSEAFNNMLDNIQTSAEELRNWSQQLEYKVQKKSEELGAAQNELIHIERIASLGKLSSSVAHEINNPLSGILIYTKLTQKQIGNLEVPPPRKASVLKNLRLIENETKRCGEIVKGLLDFSRKEQEDFVAEHIHTVLSETYALMRHSAHVADIIFRPIFEAEYDEILCSPNQLKQAFVAIIVNATEAVRENGEVLISTSNPDQDNIVVEISDNGIGIPKDDIKHIFEPFYSTKQGKSGIGLGLAIVHGIISNHKGKIDVRSELGKGTVISITLPLIST